MMRERVIDQLEFQADRYCLEENVDVLVTER